MKNMTPKIAALLILSGFGHYASAGPITSTETIFDFDLTEFLPGPLYSNIRWSAVFDAGDPIAVGDDSMLTNIYGDLGGLNLVQSRNDTLPGFPFDVSFNPEGTVYGPLTTANPIYDPMLDGTFSFGLQMISGTANLISFTACGLKPLSVEEACITFPVHVPVLNPVCEIELSQTTYVDGETITANVFRIANLTSAQSPSEWKVWLGVPGVPPISIINLGADGSLVLPAGFDVDFGPLPLVPVTAALPGGTYELSCRLLDPVTGGLLSEDLNNFIIRDANLVTNPGFESGATGWVFSDGNPENNRDVGTCPSSCTIPHTGSWAGFKNLFDGGSGTISQSIATSIGTEYRVELWLADNNVETGTVTASFGGTLGVSVTGADTSTTHSMYSFTHTATSTLTDFVFGGVVTSGTFFIDDVSIVAVQ